MAKQEQYFITVSTVGQRLIWGAGKTPESSLNDAKRSHKVQGEEFNPKYLKTYPTDKASFMAAYGEAEYAIKKGIIEVKIDFASLAKRFDLDIDMVKKLHVGDPIKLTYEWVKTGNVNFAKFKKLLRYISES